MNQKSRIIIRNLPNNLEEKDFSTLIEPFQPYIHCWYYVQGKKRYVSNLDFIIQYF